MDEVLEKSEKRRSPIVSTLACKYYELIHGKDLFLGVLFPKEKFPDDSQS